tara:strand:- start:133 stop:459 length:327 start_codon:yes stop_codon:yes gene_type:complete
MTPKLMSYNQIDFQSKFHLEAELNRIEKNVKELRGEFKKAGCLSFTVTQIWNKQGNNRLGLHYAYRDEKAFIACQKIMNGIPDDQENPSIINADRGIVVIHENLLEGD